MQYWHIAWPDLPVAQSIFCWREPSVPPIGSPQQYKLAHDKGMLNDPITLLSAGLLHVAALYDVGDAYMALAYRYAFCESDTCGRHNYITFLLILLRYQRGIGGVIRDDEVSTLFSLQAVGISSTEYHRSGGQPVAETDRIDDSTEAEVMKVPSRSRSDQSPMFVCRLRKGMQVPMILISSIRS